MCGENEHELAITRHAAGTSPHVWGKLLRGRDRDLRPRNIPTCVGKTRVLEVTTNV